MWDLGLGFGHFVSLDEPGEPLFSTACQLIRMLSPNPRNLKKIVDTSRITAEAKKFARPCNAWSGTKQTIILCMERNQTTIVL